MVGFIRYVADIIDVTIVGQRIGNANEMILLQVLIFYMKWYNINSINSRLDYVK